MKFATLLFLTPFAALAQLKPARLLPLTNPGKDNLFFGAASVDVAGPTSGAVLPVVSKR